jgi:hypothetical protein
MQKALRLLQASNLRNVNLTLDVNRFYVTHNIIDGSLFMLFNV